MKPPSRRDTPRYTHISSAGHQGFFGSNHTRASPPAACDFESLSERLLVMAALGDALPMHWDVSVDDFHDNGYRFGTIGFMFLNDRDEYGGQTSIVPRFHKLFNKWAVSPAAHNEIERMRSTD